MRDGGERFGTDGFTRLIRRQHMKDKPESFDGEFERLGEEFVAEVLEGIDEAGALSLCFPGSETGNDALNRLKGYSQEHPQIFWQWISEKFHQREHYWKPGLEQATGPTQSESNDSK
jgi:hypothetical protein